MRVRSFLQHVNLNFRVGQFEWCRGFCFQLRLKPGAGYVFCYFWSYLPVSANNNYYASEFVNLVIGMLDNILVHYSSCSVQNQRPDFGVQSCSI